MSLRRSWALFRHEMRMLMDDPGALVFLFLMPLLMMAVMKPLFALSLQADGFVGASGSEQAVPGMAAMFATFTASFAGFGFFREHGWGTWDRLRASSATTSDIMAGKLGPILFIAVAQLFVLFGIGVVLLDLVIAGSLAALSLIIVAFSLSMLSFGMAITALSRTSLQLNTFANLGGIVFAGIGGALVPISVLPEWVQSIARFTPTYWAMDGFLGVILEGQGVPNVLVPTVALFTFGAVFTGIAAVKFRFEETKVYYA
jgi:ABC-2 type transport system permease protein